MDEIEEQIAAFERAVNDWLGARTGLRDARSRDKYLREDFGRNIVYMTPEQKAQEIRLMGEASSDVGRLGRQVDDERRDLQRWIDYFGAAPRLSAMHAMRVAHLFDRISATGDATASWDLLGRKLQRAASTGSLQSAAEALSLTSYLQEKGQTAEAVRVAQEGLARFRDSTLRRKLAELLHTSGQRGESVSLLKVELKVSPEDLGLRKQIAEQLLQMGLVEDALSFLDAEIARRPQDTGLQDHRRRFLSEALSGSSDLTRDAVVRFIAGHQRAARAIEAGAGGRTEVPSSVRVPAQQMSVRPEGWLDLGSSHQGASLQKPVTVQNTGTFAFDVAIACDKDWMRVDPKLFRLEPGRSQSVAVAAETGGLTAGGHSAMLSVTAMAGAWQRMTELEARLKLPITRTLRHRWAAPLDRITLSAISVVLLFLGLRATLSSGKPFLLVGAALLSLAPFLDLARKRARLGLLFAALLLPVGGLTGFTADIWLGLARTLGLALLLGVGVGLAWGRAARDRRNRFSGAVALIGLLAVAIIVGREVANPANRWHMAGTVQSVWNTDPWLLTVSDALRYAVSQGTFSPDPEWEAESRCFGLPYCQPKTLEVRYRQDLMTMMWMSAIYDVRWSPAGDLLAVRGDAAVCGWAGEVRSTCPACPGGYCDRHVVKVLSLASKTELLSITTETAGDDGLLFSPDGRSIAFGDDTEVEIWSVPVGELQQTLVVDAAIWWGMLAFSPDGNYLAVKRKDGGVGVWALATGAELFATPPGEYVPSIALSPGAKMLAVGFKRGVTVWDVASGTEVRKLILGESPDGLAFEENGGILATTSSDTLDVQVDLWDLTDGEP